MQLTHTFVFTFFIQCNEAGLGISGNLLLCSDFRVCPCAPPCPRRAGKVLPCGLCPIPPAGGSGGATAEPAQPQEGIHGISF